MTRRLWPAVLLVSCGGESAADAEAASASESVWQATSASGQRVSLSLSGSVAVGSLTFAISTTSDGGPASSVDVLSPTMPLHGVVRYPVEAVDPQLGHVVIEIPMAGDWTLYVNLDDGSDAAEFPLRVPLPAAAGDVADHHMHTRTRQEGHDGHAAAPSLDGPAQTY
jgi:hypothetical protein